MLAAAQETIPSCNGMAFVIGGRGQPRLADNIAFGQKALDIAGAS